MIDRARCLVQVIGWPRSIKVSAQIAFDLLICGLSSWLALVIVTGQPKGIHDPLFQTIAIAIGLFIPVAIGFGLYRMVVRFIGWRSGLRIGFLIAFYLVMLVGAHFLLPDTIPLDYAIVQSILLFLMILGGRSIARYLLSRELTENLAGGQKKARVLIYGAGSAGRQLANSLIIDGQTHVIGFVDDDRGLQGCSLNGLRIHASSQMSHVIKACAVSDLYLAIPSLARHERQELLAELSALPVAVRALPTLAEVVNGKVHVSDLRPVPVEEVLGREAVAPDLALLNQDIRGKVVLVTGAGGSIGSEIARQAMRQGPRTLVLFEQNEYALYSIERELQGVASNNAIVVAILGSVTDADRVLAVFQRFGVQTVYHAAAYKHVPLVEQNPLMGIWNNVIGTRRLVEAAEKAKVDTFVLISTDKAVRPTNIMGCTKRVSELILQARQQVINAVSGQTKMTMVRFGNVLGSSGSVIPAFKAQIQAGGPVSVTHPEMVRFFMTIPEAAQLVMQAGSLGRGGDVLLLDMGEPIKINDLAVQMIHLSGLRVKSAKDPGGDIEIVYTGLRPGEKLYEELLIGDSSSPTKHPMIWIANEEMISWERLEEQLLHLEEAVKAGDSELARNILFRIVPEFTPMCINQDLLA